MRNKVIAVLVVLAAFACIAATLITWPEPYQPPSRSKQEYREELQKVLAKMKLRGITPEPRNFEDARRLIGWNLWDPIDSEDLRRAYELAKLAGEDEAAESLRTGFIAANRLAAAELRQRGLDGPDCNDAGYTEDDRQVLMEISWSTWWLRYMDASRSGEEIYAPLRHHLGCAQEARFRKIQGDLTACYDAAGIFSEAGEAWVARGIALEKECDAMRAEIRIRSARKWGGSENDY